MTALTREETRTAYILARLERGPANLVGLDVDTHRQLERLLREGVYVRGISYLAPGTLYEITANGADYLRRLRAKRDGGGRPCSPI